MNPLFTLAEALPPLPTSLSTTPDAQSIVATTTYILAAVMYILALKWLTAAHHRPPRQSRRPDPGMATPPLSGGSC